MNSKCGGVGWESSDYPPRTGTRVGGPAVHVPTLPTRDRRGVQGRKVHTGTARTVAAVG